MLLRKPVLEYYVKTTLKGMMRFLLVWTGVFLLSAIGVGMITFGVDGGVSFTGGEFAFLIAFFIGCMADFTAEFHFMFQHGVSRRSAFVGFAAHAVVTSAIYAAILYASTVLFGLVGNFTGVSVHTELFSWVYGPWLSTVGILPEILLIFLFYWVMLFMGGMFGYFLTILFYRLGKTGRTVLGISPVVLAIALPIVNTLTSGAIWRAVVWLGQTFVGRGDVPNPLNGVGVFAVVALFWLGLSWLLIRRIKLKK
ncbi:MAG: hypothetical protein FWC72_05200 [Oscillospiraceae bacterium]|nr:hypothetical protein [Oscillospiraceae bacterium]